MVTQRDLVEAHSFCRRRLVTAFVSGASGGREVEPPRRGRTIVGGVVLGVLLMAGAAASGDLAIRTQVDPHDPGHPAPSAGPTTESTRSPHLEGEGEFARAR